MSSTIQNKMSHMKLLGMLRMYQTMLDSRQHHDLTHDEFINTLIQSEWEYRENKKVNRHLRLAKFRYGASVEEINFTASRGLDKTQVLRLAEGSFIQNKENILITGATGVGKSYLGFGVRPPGLPAWLSYSLLQCSKTVYQIKNDEG